MSFYATLLLRFNMKVPTRYCNGNDFRSTFTLLETN